jgi:transposase
VPSSPVCSCLSCPAHPNGSRTDSDRTSTCGVYPSSTMTDAQWALIEPLLLPPGNTGGRGARGPSPPPGAGRDLLPGRRGDRLGRAAPGVPATSTVYGLFRRWVKAGAWQLIHDALREQARLRAGRAPAPTAATIIDSQSVRGADTVPTPAAATTPAKKVKRRKRHIAVDTNGLLLAVVVTIAGIQDRDGGLPLLAALRARFSTITLVWADAGHAGRLVTWASTVLQLVVEIVKRRDDLTGVPRSAPPLSGRANVGLDQQTPPLRPGLRDLARTPRGHVHIAMIMTMSRRLARTS